MAFPDQREEVFARIREALREPARHRHPDHSNHATTGTVPVDSDVSPPDADTFRAWLPAVGPTLDDQVALFAQNAAQLKADFRVVMSIDEANQALITLARDNNWKRIAAHHHPMIEPVAKKLGLPCLFTDPGYATADLESCDAAITSCDALVAQTGSVLVTTRSAGGRALSVLPPHHIVIAECSQMVPDLATALQLVRKKYAPDWPSFLSFITGPSRTGDIERILVLGAHGPRQLTILLIG